MIEMSTIQPGEVLELSHSSMVNLDQFGYWAHRKSLFDAGRRIKLEVEWSSMVEAIKGLLGFEVKIERRNLEVSVTAYWNLDVGALLSVCTILGVSPIDMRVSGKSGEVDEEGREQSLPRVVLTCDLSTRC
jgi:hypothetical protein